MLEFDINQKFKFGNYVISVSTIIKKCPMFMLNPAQKLLNIICESIIQGISQTVAFQNPWAEGS